MSYIIIVILILFSALFSGLTLGLMSLDTQELKRKMSLGDKNAAKVYHVRKRGNLLLCTLLIGNVAINSTLSIFLGSITSGIMAGLTATALIVIFGEITPQAVFSRFALILGAKTAWLVKIFIFILFPLCWPIAWILDKALGDELATIYSKQELMKIIEEHEVSKQSDVKAEEEKIIKGALTFSDKKVKDVMTPRSAMVILNYLQKIDKDLLRLIEKTGHSRFPVFQDSTDNIVGILYLIDLLGNKNLNKSVGQVVSKNIFSVEEDKQLGNVFSAFLRTHNHLFIAVNNFGEITGLITLEDILEEIIRSEIIDEGDIVADLRKVAKKKSKKIGRKI